MTRLPIPGSDDGSWGTILNDFLSQAHNGDGSLKPAALPTATSSSPGTIRLAGDLAGSAAAPSVPGLAGKAPLASPTFTGTVTVPISANATDAVQKTYVDTAVQGSPAYLIWNGSDYAPTALKSTIARSKVFTGPTDPGTVSGVVLAPYDIWNQTSS